MCSLLQWATGINWAKKVNSWCYYVGVFKKILFKEQIWTVASENLRLWKIWGSFKTTTSDNLMPNLLLAWAQTGKLDTKFSLFCTFKGFSSNSLFKMTVDNRCLTCLGVFRYRRTTWIVRIFSKRKSSEKVSLKNTLKTYHFLLTVLKKIGI